MLATFFSTFALSVPADAPSSPSSPRRLQRRASTCAAARAAAAPRSSAVYSRTASATSPSTPHAVVNAALSDGKCCSSVMFAEKSPASSAGLT